MKIGGRFSAGREMPCEPYRTARLLWRISDGADYAAKIRERGRGRKREPDAEDAKDTQRTQKRHDPS